MIKDREAVMHVVGLMAHSL